MSFPCPLPSINGSIAAKKLLHITKLLAKALEILDFRNHSKKVVMQERTLLKILYSYKILEVCREKGLNSSVEVTADCAGILQNIQWLSTIQFHVYGHLVVALQPKPIKRFHDATGKRQAPIPISHPARSYFEEGHQYARCAASEPPILRSCWLLLVASKTGEIRLEWKLQYLVTAYLLSLFFFLQRIHAKLNMSSQLWHGPCGPLHVLEASCATLACQRSNRCTHREMGIQYLWNGRHQLLTVGWAC